MADFLRTLETLELVGGVLCLDFVNTINSRVKPEHDYLLTYSDFVRWSNKAGILSPAQMKPLEKRAKQNQEEAERTIISTRSTRELLYRIFSNAVRGAESDTQDLENFVIAFGETVSHGQLAKQDHRYQTVWKLDESLEAILWPIVYSAGQLLHSEDLRHVKECPGCGWLFLDTSKNQSRRWCSMNTCGARDKMRRYHRKQRSK